MRIMKNAVFGIVLILLAAASLFSVASMHFSLGQSTNTFIYASAGAGGSISPSGNISVAYGGSQTFTIASNGSSLLAVLVNGTSVGAQNSVTVPNITGQTTVYATFLVSPSSAPTPRTGGSSDYGFIQHPQNTNNAHATPFIQTQTTPGATEPPTSSSTPQTTTSPEPTPNIPEFPALLTLIILVIAVIPAIAAASRKQSEPRL